MPHYADGTIAKVGDQVVGVLFNSGPAPHAGTIISITPGVESCNAMVQFTEVVPVGELRPRMAVGDPRRVKTEAHGSSGPEADVYTCADYCDTKLLTKVG